MRTFIQVTGCNATSKLGYWCQRIGPWPDPLPEHVHYHESPPLTKVGREDRRYRPPYTYVRIWNDEGTIDETVSSFEFFQKGTEFCE